MTLGAKGTRRITVDGATYRWKIRRKATYSETLRESNLLVAVEAEGKPCLLLIDTQGPRSDASMLSAAEPVVVTPAQVALAVRTALDAG